MSGRDIHLQRLIDGSTETTFHHWTDPASRRRWCAPEDGWITEAESDLRAGGAWSVSFGPTPEEIYRIDGGLLDPGWPDA